MKKGYLILCLAAILIADVSCQQDPQGSLSLSTESSNLDAAGGVINLTVESNYRWTCNSGTKDIIISQKSGDAGASGITVTVPGNPASEIREILIKFNCENAKATLTINQAGAQFDTITVQHSAIYFPAVSFDGTGFTGNINWGDGSNQDYSYYTPMADHNYEKASDYTVTITTHDTDGFFIGSMSEVEEINLTKF